MSLRGKSAFGWRALVCAILALLSLFAGAATAERAKMSGARALRQAEAAIRRGDMHTASAIAEQADRDANDGAGRSFAFLIRGLVADEREGAFVAAAEYRKAVDLASTSGDAGVLAICVDKLGRAYFAEGRWDLLLELANRMLAGPSAGDRNRGRYLLLRGTALSEMRDRAGAEQALSESLSLAEAQRDFRTVGEAHRQRGLIFWRYDHDFPHAIAEYDMALSNGRSANDPALLAETYNNSGNLFRSRFNTKNLGEAERRYSAGLAIAQNAGLRTYEAYLMKNLGEVFRQRGDARAAGILKRAVSVADRANVTEVRWMSRLSLSLALRDASPEHARRNFSECLDVIEIQHSGVLLEDLRAGAFSSAINVNENPYDSYIDFLMSRGEEAEAFYIAERERARAFLDTLAGKRDFVARELPAGYADNEAKILARIREIQATLRSERLSGARRAELLAELPQVEAELQSERLKLAAARPAIGALRFLDLKRVADMQRNVLARDESLVAFHVGRQRSYAWVVTQQGLHSVSLPARSAMEPAVRAALTDLRNAESTRGDALAALSRMLDVDRIATFTVGTHMIVVPDDVLYAVPVEAMLDRSGHRFVERFAISYAPSASSLAFMRRSRAASGATMSFLGIANPVVSGGGEAKTRQTDLTQIHLLTPVPRSSEEVHAAAATLAGPSTVLEGAKATRSELSSAGLNRARIVHFATHGLVDEDRPQRSGLLLTPQGPGDDGLLQARDIYPMRIHADLVTLSACETALGRSLSGEGVLGLTRAFFYAGARSVVSSLWNVDDASTSQLMRSFYGHIADGDSIDVALQRAKLDLIRKGPAAPFFWAAFIANGDARIQIPVTRRRWLASTSGILTIAMLVVVALLVMGGAYFQRRRVRARIRAAAR